MGNAAIARHPRRLHEGGAEPAGREAGVVGEMPVLHAALDRLVLAHGRHHRAVPHRGPAQRKRREELRLGQAGLLADRPGTIDAGVVGLFRRQAVRRLRALGLDPIDEFIEFPHNRLEFLQPRLASPSPVP